MREWYNENKVLAVILGVMLVAAVALTVFAIITNRQAESKDTDRPSVYNVQEVEKQLNDSAVHNNPEVKVLRTDCMENARNEFRCVVLFQDRKTNAGGFTHLLIRYRDDGTGTVTEIEDPPGPAPRA